MNDPIRKLNMIERFINDYMEQSQKRGRMYGTVEMLESNWVILDHMYFILNDLEHKEADYNFGQFLMSRDFGAKSAASVITERHVSDPYLELNKLWNEYVAWREQRIGG